MLGKISCREAVVGVLRLGYVSLPLVLEMTRARFSVTGIYKDASKIESLKRGCSYI